MAIEMNKLEKDVMNKLLQGECDCLQELRRQFSDIHAVSREMTGAGFYLTFSTSNTSHESILPPRGTLGDVYAEVPGLDGWIGFILFLDEKGKIDFLEGHTYGENWPVDIREWRLFYEPAERDLSGIICNQAE